MVVFVCGKCNESIKKKSVEQHFHNCRTKSISCVDCSKDFTLQTYGAHISCITEQEKYDKPNFVQKGPKGAAKQLGWTEKVHSRLKSFTCVPGVPTLMVKKLLGSTNIPRKKSKLENFLKSAFKFARQVDIDKVWEHINAGDISTTVPEKTVSTLNNSDNKCLKEESLLKPRSNSECVEILSEPRSNKKRKLEETEVQPVAKTSKHGDSESVSKCPENKKSSAKDTLTITTESSNELSLREAVMLHLRGQGKPMRIKKLRRKALETFRSSNKFNLEDTEEALQQKFDKILRSKRRFTLSEDEKDVSITTCT